MKWASLLLFFLTLPLVFNAPPLEILRLKTFDALIETPDPTGYFTILNIDEEYLDKEGGYPLPRKTLADIHLKLLQKGALGVGWVMLFPHPDRLGGDKDFAYMLSLAPSVIAMPEINNEQYPETHGTVILGPDVTLPQAQGFLENIPQLKEASAQGAVSVPVDVDNLVRQIPLIQQTPEGWVASFGTEVLKILGGGNTYQIKTNENGIEMIRVKGIPPIPTDSSGKKWISWVDTPETTMSEMDVKDKFVFVGFTAKGIMPQVATPVGLLEPHKIQAALAESILLETPNVPEYRLLAEFSLLVFFGLLISLLTHSLGITKGIVAAGFTFFSVGSLGWYFISKNLLIDVTWTLISMFILSALQFYLNFRTQFKLRQQIKKQFEHYLDPRQVKRLQDNPELLKLGGEKRYCTILFTDVRGFTSLSERLEPEEVTEIMNKVLTIQENAVKANDGMVDKYIGDAMMAIFNAPMDVEEQEDKAIRTAIQIAHEIKAAELDIAVGIGINSDRVVVGNCGSSSRFDYTAIGDGVNLAARLESSTKEVGQDIVIGEKTMKGSSFDLIPLESILVKGKEKPVNIYTVNISKH